VTFARIPCLPPADLIATDLCERVIQLRGSGFSRYTGRATKGVDRQLEFEGRKA
jgi:hypothetical protein